MKSKNNKAMKTKVFLTTVIIILITVFTYVDSTARVRHSMMTSFLVNDTEEGMTLEPWMVNDHYWMCIENNCLARDWDKAPELESWMTNGVEWDINEMITMVKDETLHLEPWMSGNEGIWTSKTSTAQEKDRDLVLEEWMTSEASWIQK